jgi:hypothetical protein
MLSHADVAAERAERQAIEDQVGDLEWVQSHLQAMQGKMEEQCRHGMSDTIAGWMDRLGDMIGEIDHEIGTLMRS